jgi:hypothetical protein
VKESLHPSGPGVTVDVEDVSVVVIFAERLDGEELQLAFDVGAWFSEERKDPIASATSFA